MPPKIALSGGEDGSNRFVTNIEHLLQDCDPPASKIISRSIISASFSGEDRFDWVPDSGLRVSIPDEHAFVPFERASAAELCDRLFSFPHVCGHGHKSAPQPQALPEQSLAWWFAQMVHYGLPITINKQSAQESIRAAILADRLIVPPRLGELEMRLKRQYAIMPGARVGTTKNNKPFSQAVTTTNRSTDQADVQTEPCGKKLSSLQVNVPPPRDTSNHLSAPAELQNTSNTICNTGSESDMTSSSESEREPTPKPGHLFTPNGHRILRPAEYPGLLEKEEAAKNNQVSPLSTSQPGSRAVDAKQVDVDIEDFTNHPDGQIAKLKEVAKLERKMDNSANYLQKNDVWGLEDTDSDETGSLIFYTPMDFLKRDPNRYVSQDQESVILTGSQKKSLPSRNGIISPLAQPKRQRSVKHTLGEVEEYQSDFDEPVIEEEAALQNRPSSARNKSATGAKLAKKVAKGKAFPGARVRPIPSSSSWDKRVIEISSGSDDSSDDNGKNEIESEEEPSQIRNKGSKFVSLSQANISQRRQSMKDITLKPEPKSNSSTTDLSAHKPVSQTGSGKHRSGSQNTTKKPKSRRVGKDVEPETPVHEKVTSGKAGRAKQRTASEKIVEKSRGPSNKTLDTSPQSCVDQQPGHHRGDVHDYTGCGITEAIGALHTDDESAIPIVQRHRSRFQSSDLVQPQLPEVPTGSPDLPPLPLHMSSGGSDSESDLPCVMKLFSSQDTPENWKSKERRALEKARKQAEIDKSFDPDSVPALREQLATAPAWMRNTIRHDSLELPHRSPFAPANQKPKSTPKNAHGRRSRSKSIAASRKRDRPSLVEIESSRRPSKKARMAPSGPESAPTADVRRASPILNTLSSIPRSKKPHSVRRASAR